MWIFYAIIPLVLTGLIVYFFIKRKTKKNDENLDDLNKDDFEHKIESGDSGDGIWKNPRV